MSYPFIETLGSISETVGYKLAPNLNAIMLAIKEFCRIKPGSESTSPADLDNDIKDVCLRIFDNSIKKCPKEVSAYLDEIMQITLELMGYDPNFNPDVVMNEGEEDMEGWGNVMEEARVEDDSSWKVRRSAVRILGTVVKCRQDKIKGMYDKVVAKVLERLCEREESIKCDIIQTFSNMIKGVVVGAPAAVDEIESAMLLKRKSSAEYLLKDLPAAVSKIVGHYGDKSQKVREAIASLLLNMSIAVPDYMNGSLLGTVLPVLVFL